MSEDINLVAVCPEKRGRPINRPGQRQRAGDTERGNNGQPSGGEPQQLQGPTSQHTPSCTCGRALPYTLPLSPSLSRTLFSPSCTLWPGHLKGSQLSRCSTTGFTKGTKWVVEEEKQNEKQLPHFLPHCWVSMCINLWSVLVACPLEFW